MKELKPGDRVRVMQCRGKGRPWTLDGAVTEVDGETIHVLFPGPGPDAATGSWYHRKQLRRVSGWRLWQARASAFFDRVLAALKGEG